jgi:outer membrane protein OmpA-like peptidoglycan-associated protein
VWDWLANEDWKSYRSVRAGLTVYRSPNRHAEVAALPPMMMHHDDSVSAAETRRLRASEMALRALRDSLARVPAPVSPANVATMQARIHFAFDKSDLTDSAKAILDDKVAVFRDNPTMSIMVMGYADNIGTDAYNMALGTRRAEAAKAYIVSKGIDGSRIIIDSKGERQPVTEASGVAGQAPNRRAIFRLSIASDGSNQEE